MYMSLQSDVPCSPLMESVQRDESVCIRQSQGRSTRITHTTLNVMQRLAVLDAAFSANDDDASADIASCTSQ